MAQGWKAAMIIITCGIIGILFAIMVQMLNTDEILVNSLISGDITLKAVQAFIIIFWTGMGVIISAAMSR